MKKFFRLLILLLAFSLLSGCGGQPGYEPDSDGFGSYSDEDASSEDISSAPDSPDSSVGPWGFLPSDSSEPEQPVFTVTEPPLTDWMLEQPLPDFLNEEQMQVFQHAYCAAGEIFMGCYPFGGLEGFPLIDGSTPPGGDYESVQYDSMTYTVSKGRYRQWNDFQSMMDGLFTPEYQRELLGTDSEYGPMFRSTEDGLLCFIDGARGDNMEYDGSGTDTYELVSQTGDEICFDLIGHYTEQNYDSEAGELVPGAPYTQRYPIRMVRTDQGWRVSEIHIPW